MTETPRKSKREAELEALDHAIEKYPDAAINYALRGEFWMKQREHQMAAQDFETAIELAKLEKEASPWEFREQAVLDRSELLLRMVTQYL